MDQVLTETITRAPRRRSRTVRVGKAQLSKMGSQIAQVLTDIGVPPPQWVGWISDKMEVSKYAAHKWLYDPRQQIGEENATKLTKVLARASGRPFSLADLRATSRGRLAVGRNTEMQPVTTDEREALYLKVFRRMTRAKQDVLLDTMLDSLVPAGGDSVSGRIVLHSGQREERRSMTHQEDRRSSFQEDEAA